MSVHSTHCCVIHGCKYGDDNCPVVNRIEIQEYPCESCNEFVEGWNLVSDFKYPTIPEGKYGIMVECVVFDPIYSDYPDKNLSIERINYSKIHDRYGRILEGFKGSLYDIHEDEEAFMTLTTSGNWIPLSDEVIAWRYIKSVSFLTQYVIDETKKNIFE